MNLQEKLLEQALILQCQAGSAEAFELIFARYSGRLKYFLRRLLGPARDVDDICQEVWLTVFKGLQQLRNPDAFRVWLYRIARNRAYQELRKERTALPAVATSEMAEEIEEEEFRPEDAAAIHQGLEKLQADHKDVLMLRFLEEMSYEDIAQTLGCSLGTVRSRIHYAKRALRTEMEALSDEENR